MRNAECGVCKKKKYELLRHAFLPIPHSAFRIPHSAFRISLTDHFLAR